MTDLKRIMDEVDSEGIISPEDRAKRVFDHIMKGNFTNWDLLCFSAIYIRSQAIVPELSWLEQPAIQLNRLIYLAHYVQYKGDVDGIGKPSTDDVSSSDGERDESLSSDKGNQGLDDKGKPRTRPKRNNDESDSTGKDSARGS